MLDHLRVLKVPKRGECFAPHLAFACQKRVTRVRSTLLLFFSSGGPSGADPEIYGSMGMTLEFCQFFLHVIFKVLTFQKSRSNENSITLP